MTVCSTCGAPMVWSHRLNRLFCAVYGTHPKPTPTPLFLRAVTESFGRRVA